MSDLVERLREGVAFRPNIAGGFSVDLSGTVAMMNEAADHITALEAELLETCKREAETQRRHDATVEALEAQVAAADRLAEWASNIQHSVGCNSHYWYKSTRKHGECTCGMTPALAAYRAARGESHEV